MNNQAMSRSWPNQLFSLKANIKKVQYGEWVGALAQGTLGTQPTALFYDSPNMKCHNKATILSAVRPTTKSSSSKEAANQGKAKVAQCESSKRQQQPSVSNPCPVGMRSMIKTRPKTPCYLASKVLFWHGENCAQAPVPPTPHAVPHVVRQRYPAAPLCDVQVCR